MNHAICVRCGGDKASYERVCPACGHRPEGDGLLVAWLLSSAYLTDDKLRLAAARVRRGEAIRPSDRMLSTARRALGTHVDTDPGLTRGQQAAIFATACLFTPFVGFLLWVWWLGHRPRSAWRALWLSLPAGVVFAAGVSWLALQELGGL